MATTVRAKLSEKNKYWISKHRYYELKHFCLQFPIWKQAYASLDEVCISPNNLKIITSTTNTTATKIKQPLANVLTEPAGMKKAHMISARFPT